MLAWNMGDIYGSSNPTRLPAPTTCSWSQTWIMWPLEGYFCKLHILDAERAQGLPPGHTARDGADPGNTEGSRTQRFKCVGNALPGEVRDSADHLSPLQPATTRTLGQLAYGACVRAGMG